MLCIYCLNKFHESWVTRAIHNHLAYITLKMLRNATVAFAISHDSRGHYTAARCTYMYVPRINLVRLMKPCFPVFRCSRDPHCRTAGSTEEELYACTETFASPRALRKNEAEKWPSLHSQPPDNSIVRRRGRRSDDVSCADSENA